MNYLVTRQAKLMSEQHWWEWGTCGRIKSDEPGMRFKAELGVRGQAPEAAICLRLPLNRSQLRQAPLYHCSLQCHTKKMFIAAWPAMLALVDDCYQPVANVLLEC